MDWLTWHFVWTVGIWKVGAIAGILYVLRNHKKWRAEETPYDK